MFNAYTFPSLGIQIELSMLFKLQIANTNMWKEQKTKAKGRYKDSHTYNLPTVKFDPAMHTTGDHLRSSTLGFS